MKRLSIIALLSLTTACFGGGVVNDTFLIEVDDDSGPVDTNPGDTGKDDTGKEDTGKEDTGQDTGPPSGPKVQIVTGLGTVVLVMADDAAPLTTANFLKYVDDGFYDGDDGAGATLFHRVIPGFMAQGGGTTESGTQKTTRQAIVNESDNGLSNARGTIAMARTSDPDSATSQFFINVDDNSFLDVDGSYPPGYAVFGEVISGMDVVDAMVAVSTDSNDKPTTDIVIQDMERVQ
jgi:cyclophilin family peptidyl-prolyl cis-trans isomerase